MVVAMLLLKSTHGLVSVGEGVSRYHAKADAIVNCPPQNWDIQMIDCEWEIEELASEVVAQ
jgi:hypothetical protein